MRKEWLIYSRLEHVKKVYYVITAETKETEGQIKERVNSIKNRLEKEGTQIGYLLKKDLYDFTKEHNLRINALRINLKKEI